MKFTHSLNLNAVPEWQDHYINYSMLKKLIYQIEKPSHDSTTSIHVDDDTKPLLVSPTGHPLDVTDPDALFSKTLDRELDRIVRFYKRKEGELLKELAVVLADLAHEERISEFGAPAVRPSKSLGGAYTTDELVPAPGPTIGTGGDQTPLRPGDGPADASSPSLEKPSTSQQPFTRRQRAEDSSDDDVPKSPRRRATVGDVQDRRASIGSMWEHPGAKHSRTQFRQRLINLFVLLVELKDFADLNYTGFRKALKKYDKVIGRHLKSSYMRDTVDPEYPWLPETRSEIEDAIDRVTVAYARLTTDGNKNQASMELRSNLREHIVWERNTVWRDMIEQERRAASVKLKAKKLAEAEGDVGGETVWRIPGLGEVRVPTISRAMWTGLFCFLVFVVLLVVPIFPTVEQENCFAILVLASLLWATEVMPLFVTALLVPFLVVVLGVLRFPDTGERMDAKNAAKKVFSDMFSPVIMLLLGGFTLAAALSKHHIAKMMASTVLRRAGTAPKWVLMAMMSVAAFLSMWISNVAAPVLCFSLIQPILRTLPHKSPYAKVLVLGIALASNIGGMSTPISSPQNIIAIGNMTPAPTWAQWLAVSIPLCVISILLVWALLLLIHRPPSEATAPPEIYMVSNEPITGTQWYVIAVSAGTIVLWCLESTMENVVGDMGVLAVLPIVFFFGSGVLTKDDFNNFLWTVIVLAMGGISLGKAVDSSGLLKAITDAMSPALAGLSPLLCLIIFAGLVAVVTSFISHTVGALIILPVVAQVGASLPDPHPRLLVMGVAFMCSGAMALPVSSYPNMNAISLEDPTGVPWLDVKDFLVAGIPGTAVVWAAIVTVGYALMTFLLGF
ncbi:SPX domain-containing protein [Hyaloraphidium curvatum]|nr:SPX domain-containing protein [Hyaloraphidium curvatum]